MRTALPYICGRLLQRERKIISERIKAALEPVRARGSRLGNPRLAEARAAGYARSKATAEIFAAAAAAAIRHIRDSSALPIDPREPWRHREHSGLQQSRAMTSRLEATDPRDEHAVRTLRQVVPIAAFPGSRRAGRQSCKSQRSAPDRASARDVDLWGVDRLREAEVSSGPISTRALRRFILHSPSARHNAIAWFQSSGLALRVS